MGSNSNTIYDIIILGAGVSGIGMAHSLLKEKDQTLDNEFKLGLHALELELSSI